VSGTVTITVAFWFKEIYFWRYSYSDSTSHEETVTTENDATVDEDEKDDVVSNASDSSSRLSEISQSSSVLSQHVSALLKSHNIPSTTTTASSPELNNKTSSSNRNALLSQFSSPAITLEYQEAQLPKQNEFRATGVYVGDDAVISLHVMIDSMWCKLF